MPRVTAPRPRRGTPGLPDLGWFFGRGFTFEAWVKKATPKTDVYRRALTAGEIGADITTPIGAVP